MSVNRTHRETTEQQDDTSASSLNLLPPLERVSEQIWPEGWNPAQVKPHPAGYDEWKARRQEHGRDDEEN